jgi:hypothetical protein
VPTSPGEPVRPLDTVPGQSWPGSSDGGAIPASADERVTASGTMASAGG